MAILDEEKINYELIEEVVWRIVAGAFDRHLPLAEQPVKDDDAVANAVLVFLPGLAEIETLYHSLRAEAESRATGYVFSSLCVHQLSSLFGIVRKRCWCWRCTARCPLAIRNWSLNGRLPTPLKWCVMCNFNKLIARAHVCFDDKDIGDEYR